MFDFFDKLDVAWIFGGIIVAFFAGGITSFIALFGWSLAKTFKNAKDLGAAHSAIRSHRDRLKRLEKYVNGGLFDGQEHIVEQDVLGGGDNGPCSIVPGD